MKDFFKLLKGKKGASAVEYALMVALIAAAITTTVVALGDKVKSTFAYVANAMPGF